MKTVLIWVDMIIKVFIQMANTIMLLVTNLTNYSTTYISKAPSLFLGAVVIFVLGYFDMFSYKAKVNKK